MERSSRYLCRCHVNYGGLAVKEILIKVNGNLPFWQDLELRGKTSVIRKYAGTGESNVLNIEVTKCVITYLPGKKAIALLYCYLPGNKTKKVTVRINIVDFEFMFLLDGNLFRKEESK